jgi:hypothetical protein
MLLLLLLMLAAGVNSGAALWPPGHGEWWERLSLTRVWVAVAIDAVIIRMGKPLGWQLMHVRCLIIMGVGVWTW